ncbi:hypothetical protein PLESTB_000019800 [Pleodorina starrii]|uniref:Ankyrin repeat domain-containing protein n=1 Tax=Pleodorina starrii TaxID=330485 RepID=A0A9W6EX78_9CHLO|nr:hypothetical protein PLESTM_001115000 [Pleodorina starrii]GLC47731.1 hypothetical protein PLESTB_000019800 [Pleodorina starrii]GLC70857.1 hypothetical protein PLESTF_001040400 [Pleodorina starrii]
MDPPSETKWDDLSSDLIKRIADCLPPAEIACTFRLINKAAAKLFPAQPAVHLSEPVPCHFFVWYWSRPEEALHNLTLKQRRQLLVLTARSGCLANLKVALDASGCPLTEEVFDAAAVGGHLHTCQWLLARFCPRGRTAVSAAARAGHLPTVLWLLQQERHPSHRRVAQHAAWAAAAGAGQRALCQGLAAEGINFDWSALISCARGGHQALFDWLLEPPQIRPKVPEPPPTRLFASPVPLLAAAAHGLGLAALQRLHAFLHSLRLLRADAPEALDGALAEALASPTPDWRAKVQWLREQGAVLDPDDVTQDITKRLVTSGQQRQQQQHQQQHQQQQDDDDDRLERVQLLLEWLPPDALEPAVRLLLRDSVRAANLPLVRYLWQAWPDELPGATAAAPDVAAEAGDVVVLSELAALGWELGTSAAWAAARAGRLHVLQWLEGRAAAPADGEEALWTVMDERLTAAAAESGSCELMAWLRERGCGWDERSFEAAVRCGGSPAFLEWLVEEGCPTGVAGEPYRLAGRNGDMVTVRCLRQLGCPWGPDGNTFDRAFYQPGGSRSLAVRR